MAYATVDDLAVALNIRATPENSTLLADCLDAAAAEIDHHLGPHWLIEDEFPPPLVKRTNVNRGVEWYKASDMFNGGVGVGTQEMAELRQPASGFERHALVLLPYKTSWGLA